MFTIDWVSLDVLVVPTVFIFGERGVLREIVPYTKGRKVILQYPTKLQWIIPLKSLLQREVFLGLKMTRQ